jgi:hypothetical protein
MGFDPYESQQRAMLRSAVQAAGISVGDLWLHYFSLGGAVGEYEVEAYLQGLLALPALQRDVLALAANELIEEIPRPRAPYSDELTGGTGECAEKSDPDEPAEESRPDRQDRE